MLLAYIRFRFITHLLCPSLYAPITNELIFRNAVLHFLNVFGTAAYQVWFKAMRLKDSPHQDVSKYSKSTPHTLPVSI